MPHSAHTRPPLRRLDLDRRPEAADLRPPPGSIYTAMRRVEGGGVPGLTHHLDRLWASAAALGWRPTHTRRALRAALRAAGRDGSPGPTAMLLDLHPDGGGVLACWPLAPPCAAGARLACARPGAARTVPAAKDSAWRADRRSWETDRAADDHVLEGPDGALLEGFTSTLLFARGGRIVTQGAGALPGVTRRLLTAPFAALGLEVVAGATRWSDLAATSEVAMASALRGLRPVVQVGAHRVGGGRPGPIMTAAHHALERHLTQVAEAP